MTSVWSVSSSKADPYTRGHHPVSEGPKRPALLPVDAYCLAEFTFAPPDGGYGDVSWCIELANMLALCNSRTPTTLYNSEEVEKLNPAHRQRRGLLHPLALYANLQLFRPVGKDLLTTDGIDDEALRILAWNASVPQCRQFSKYLTPDRIADFLNFVARNGDVELFFEALVRPDDAASPASPTSPSFDRQTQGALSTQHWHTAGAILARFYTPTPKDIFRWMSTASANGHSKLLNLLFKIYGVPELPHAEEGLIMDATESGALHLLVWLHGQFPHISLQQCFPLAMTLRKATIASTAAQCGHVKVLDWLMNNKRIDVMTPITRSPLARVAPSMGSYHLDALPHFAAARANQVEVLEWMFRQHINLSAQDEEGKSLFHYAAEWGATDAIRWMHNKGIDIWQPDSKGNTVETLVASQQQRQRSASQLGNLLAALKEEKEKEERARSQHTSFVEEEEDDVTTEVSAALGTSSPATFSAR